MLRELSSLKGLAVAARDGDIGTVYDVYFDAERWTVRYFVVDTGTWLSARRVLLSPMSLDAEGVSGDRLNVRLTRAQVEEAPSWDTDKPVSRQHEIAHAMYYGYPYYWLGPARWGPAWDPWGGLVAMPHPNPVAEEILAREESSADSNLHSAREVIGYHVQAADDQVGHVEDFLVDLRAWAIRYIVVDTRNWLPGRRVVLAPAWIRSVDWDESKVHVDLPRKEVETAPEYDPNAPMMRDLETRLHEHYGRAAYWDEERDHLDR